MLRAALIAALACAAVPARAQTALVVSSVGRGEALVRYLEPLAGALPDLEPVWGERLRRAVEQRFGEPARALPAAKLEAVRGRVERAEQGLLLGDLTPAAAAQLLEAQRKVLLDAPGALARDDTGRSLYQRLLLTLARAYQVKRQPQLAAERMGEYVLAFSQLPTRPAPSPALVELQRDVVAQLTRRPHGGMVVDKGPGTLVMNGRVYDCPASCAIHSLFGEYRLFVAAPEGLGRLHRVVIGEGKLSIALDVPFEVALASDGAVGFAFADAAAQARDERRFAQKLGRELGYRRVVVLATPPAGEHESLVLRAYLLPGERVVEVPLASAGPVSPAQLVDLAHRLQTFLPAGK